MILPKSTISPAEFFPVLGSTSPETAGAVIFSPSIKSLVNTSTFSTPFPSYPSGVLLIIFPVAPLVSPTTISFSLKFRIPSILRIPSSRPSCLT